MNSQRADLYYVAVGDGEPILVIHGGPGLDHSYLLPYLQPLGDNYFLIFYDQRATGQSGGTATESEITLPRFIADLEALRKGLNLAHVHLMGHGWGSLLAIHYALTYPHHVKSLILLNPMAMSSDELENNIQRMVAAQTAETGQKLANMASSEAVLRGHPQAINEYLSLLFLPYWGDSNKRQLLSFAFNEHTAKNGLLVSNLMRNHLGRYDLSKELRRLKTATLIVTGDRDICPLNQTENVHRLIEHSKLVVLKGSGHFPFIEQPEEFLNQIRSFIHSTNR